VGKDAKETPNGNVGRIDWEVFVDAQDTQLELKIVLVSKSAMAAQVRAVVQERAADPIFGAAIMPSPSNPGPADRRGSGEFSTASFPGAATKIRATSSSSRINPVVATLPFAGGRISASPAGSGWMRSSPPGSPSPGAAPRLG
jgi:hypothetical protein